jgi:hypothetical protein
MGYIKINLKKISFEDVNCVFTDTGLFPTAGFSVCGGQPSIYFARDLKLPLALFDSSTKFVKKIVPYFTSHYNERKR